VLDERPIVAPDLLGIFTAFITLSRGRNVTAFGSPAPISFESIDRYATRLNIDTLDDFERFVEIIATLDSVYLTAQSEKKKDTK
tara:strand:- start:154 stop:405 length:252 start_codon:yes stop_codon:yes gene_type:complete